MKATAKNVIKAKNAALVVAQEVLASDSKVSKKFRKEIAEKIVIPARKLRIERPNRKTINVDFVECGKYTKETSGNKVGRDRAPGAPTVADYRKALDSAKYLLDALVDAMERKRNKSHRQLTMDDCLLPDRDFTRDYWSLPECQPGVGEKFQMIQSCCAGVTPAVREIRELVDFILGGVKEGK